jgi:hypothetical protein
MWAVAPRTPHHTAVIDEGPFPPSGTGTVSVKNHGNIQLLDDGSVLSHTTKSTFKSIGMQISALAGRRVRSARNR